MTAAKKKASKVKLRSRMSSPILGVVLLAAYSYGVVAIVYFGTRAVARRCCSVSLSFPFWPLAVATTAIVGFVGTELLRPGTFFSAGIGLVILQFFASALAAIGYVVVDGTVTVCRWQREGGLPPCEAEGERGCVVRRERQQRALSTV